MTSDFGALLLFASLSKLWLKSVGCSLRYVQVTDRKEEENLVEAEGTEGGVIFKEDWECSHFTWGSSEGRK